MRQRVQVAWALAAITLASAGRAQDSPAPADIDALVTRFVKTSGDYQKAFLNLVAEETKVAENFDQSGGLVKRREIVSDLVVYRSHDSKDTAEYRDVLSVDGKPVAKRNKRALDLLTRASQSTSMEKELNLINREGQRSDLGFSTVGATINQISGAVLKSREKFRIDWVGRDRIAGHDVLVLDYQEKSPNRDHSDAKFYTQYGFSGGIIRGRLWLDAATAQLRRDRWDLVNFPSGAEGAGRFLSPGKHIYGEPVRYPCPRTHGIRGLWPGQSSEKPAAIMVQDCPQDLHVRRIPAI